MRTICITAVALCIVFSFTLNVAAQANIGVAPDSLDEHLLSGGTSTQQLLVTNSGNENLTIEIISRLVSTATASSPESASQLLARLVANHDANAALLSQESQLTLHPQEPGPTRPSLTASSAGVYTGDYLSFGLSEYGEVMPFQYPVGVEHLNFGTLVSGYTVAYKVSGVDNLAYAAYHTRSRIVPVSYTEVLLSPTKVIVEVVTKSSDNILLITRTFSFDKAQGFVNILSRVKNASGAPVTDVVFKVYADWDTDGMFSNNWDYDLSRNMIYAWDTQYTAIASSRVPEYMDIDGWADYNRRATNVNFPTGPLLYYDGLEILHFELGNLDAGGSSYVESVYGAGSTLAELQSAIDLGSNVVGWIHVTSASINILPGNSQLVDVGFDSEGLREGHYLADLLINSNDPDQPQVRVPTHLAVTGVPKIRLSLASINFGSIFVGGTASSAVSIKSVGTKLLEISNVISSNPDFIPGATTFSLYPGEEASCTITFVPSGVGQSSGTLTFMSNDPHEPAVSVSLTGYGIDPPDIAVAPDSFDVHLHSGDLENKILSISNLGGYPLYWTASFEPATSGKLATYTLPAPSGKSGVVPADSIDANPTATVLPTRTEALTATLKDLTGVTILLDESHSNMGGGYGGTMETDLLSRGATLSANYSQIDSAVLANADILWLVDFYMPLLTSEISAIRNWLLAGGRLVIEGDQSIEDYNALFAAVGAGIAYSQQPAVIGATADISSHPITTNVNSILIPYSLARLSTVTLPATALVRDSSGFVHAAYSIVGSGRIVVVADQDFTDYYIGFNDNELFGNQVFDWLATSAGAVTVSDGSGSTPAGLSTEITVTFNAKGAYGGNYFVDLMIESNDPDEPRLRIPARMHVTGVPNIVAEPNAIDFGVVYLTASAMDTVVVANVGTDSLHITSISSNNADFVPGLVSVVVAPGSNIEIPVTFSPSVDGPIDGTLTVQSNDPDSPVITVALLGQGRIPPDITVFPDSLDASLFVFAQENQTLTIGNVSGTELNWSLNAVRLNGPTSAKYSLSVPLSRPSLDPALAGLFADSNAIPWSAATIQSTLLDLTGVNILFDQHHGNYASYNWSTMISSLQSRGATITNNYSAVTSTILQDVDIFWLGGNFTAWSGAEITALKNWVTAGGALLIDGGEATNNVNAILSALGSGMAFTAQYPVYGPTTNILAHQTTVGVHKLYLHHAASYISSVVGPASTIVKEPSGVVNVAGSHIGFGRIVAVSDYKFFDWVIGNYDNHLFDNQVFDWLASAPKYLTADITSGTVAAGGSSTITVTFDAANLIGGDYLTDLIIESNDPDESHVRIPTHLHVTGAPNIVVAPDTLKLGEVFIGYNSTALATVENNGTDVLTVSAVTSSLPDFAPGTTAFTLRPGETGTTPITFSPSSAGSKTGLLSFISNDPDLPSASISLSGTGLVPPVIAVSPDSLSADLYTDAVQDQTLTISNLGGSELKWTLGIVSADSAGKATYTLPLPSGRPAGSTEIPDVTGVAWNTTATVATLSDLTGVRILFDRAHSNYDPGNWYIMINNLTSRGATIVYNYSPITSAVLQNIDIFWLVDHTGSWSALELTALGNWVSAGGGLLTEGALYKTGFNAVFTALGVGFTYTSQSPSYGMTTAISPHPTTVGVDKIYCHYVYSRITGVTAPAGVIMKDPAGSDYVVARQIGNGRIMAITDYSFYDGAIGVFDNQLFGNQVFDWLAHSASFIRTNTSSGAIAAGNSAYVTATFDATDLIGGDYQAELVFTSNDSANPQVHIPARLHVTGAPNIFVTPPSLDFGMIFVGYQGQQNVTVTNDGTEILHVSSVTSSNPSFVPGVTAFSVSPGSHMVVPITFSPGTAGTFNELLTIVSDDPDMLTTSVPLIALALIPPDIAVAPDSLSADLFVGMRENRALTINNTGGSDLNWTCLVVERNASKSSAVSLTVPPVSPSPDPAVASGPLADSNDTSWRSGAVVATLLDLTGVKILFDQKHGNYSYDNWSLMFNDLTSRGATIAINYSTVTATALQDVNIFWLGGNFWSWGASEITALKNWIIGGGALLIDGGEATGNINAILTQLGAGMQFTAQTAVYGSTTNILPHATTVGVDKLYLHHAASRISSVVSPTSVIVKETGGANNVACRTIGFGRLVAVSDYKFFDWTIGKDDNQIFNNQVFDWLSRASSFVVTDRESGVLAANLSTDITITFDATNQYGGDYFADVIIGSNDPDEPSMTVPANLHVTGAPDIDPLRTALAYPTTFTGVSVADTIRIVNRGTDLLVVSGITAGNGHFTVNPTNFPLAPGQTQLIEVTFAPLSDGDHSTNLTITSNDPDEPAALISLSGSGLYPPKVQLNPGSFYHLMNLAINPIVVDTLEIRNTGLSDLIWGASLQKLGRSSQFALDPPGSEVNTLPYATSHPEATQVFLRAEPIHATLLDLSEIDILFDQYHSNYYSYNWSTMISNLRSRGATVTDNYSLVSAAVLAPYEIFWVGGNFGYFAASEIAALKIWIEHGGSLLIDGGEATVSINNLLYGLGVGMQFTSQAPFYGRTANVLPHDITAGIDTVYLHHAASRITSVVAPAVVIVKEPGGANNVVCTPLGIGRIMAVSDYKFFNWTVGAYDNQLFDNQAFDWLANHVKWVTLDIYGDTVPAGMSSTVSVTFNGAPLANGDYSASISVLSNDPVTPVTHSIVNVQVLQYLCGDANTDGGVTAADFNFLWNTYFQCGLPPSPFGSGDVNCDGIVNLTDLWMLERYLHSSYPLDCCSKK